MKQLLALAIILLSIQWSCTSPDKSPQEDVESTEINPAAEGFNLEASDEKAIALADEVMEAMGGRKNWDATRYIRWNFFGRRTLL